MTIWEKVVYYAKQRRVWSFVISIVAMGATALGYTDAASTIIALATAGGLSLWSFSKPKA